MKILYISDDFPPVSFGGAGIVAFRDARDLAFLGHEVHVLTCVHDKDKIGIIKIDNLIIHRIYSSIDERWRQWRSIYNPSTINHAKKIIDDIHPEVIHIHNVHGCISYWIMRYCSKICNKVFHTIHDLYSVFPGKLYPRNDGSFDFSLWDLIRFSRLRFNPFRNILIRFCFRKLSKIFVVSEAVNKLLISHGIKNTEVLHNGIEIDTAPLDQNKKDEFINRFGLKNKRIIFFGGRISNAKGISVAIESFSRLFIDYQDIVLLIAGNLSSNQQMIKEKIHRYGIDDKIIFTGWINESDMKIAISISEFVLVLSQYLDPFPTINLEAFSQSKPVIGSIFGGSKEVIQDGISGFIVDTRFCEQIVEKCKILLDNKELRQNMSNMALKTVKEKYVLRKHTDHLLLCYNRP